MRGAVARARQVTADILGNLNTESLQDTSTFDSKQTSIGGRVTVGCGFAASASYTNSAAFDGQSVSVGAGFGESVGRDQQGRAETGAGQVPATTLPTLGGFSATPPIALSASGDTPRAPQGAVSAPPRCRSPTRPDSRR